MDVSWMMLLTVVFPFVWGIALLMKKDVPSEAKRDQFYLTGLAATGILLLITLLGGGEGITLLRLGEGMELYFHADALGKFFAVPVGIVCIAAGFYSVNYMEHEGGQKRFYGFYLMSFGAVLALCFAGNLLTFYLFYEMMTLLTLPLVIHTGTREAIWAGVKYLLYSLGGAYLALFGIYFLNQNVETLNFTAGGCLLEAAAGRQGLLLFVVFLMILGFGVKAGMFPLHAWLSAAHPVAPAPASAVLSGIVAKMGVLGVIRVVYYLTGPDLIRGSWVQNAWMVLSLLTVFMGSMLAYREGILKKRLAYSTVSQISYILFGLAVLQPEAMAGSLLHVMFHAVIKGCLFLSAGAMIFSTGKTKVTEFQGIGREMPVTLWCYTFASLALIGIPPASGFISKWHLAVGALDSGIPVFSWLGPVVLLVSALLTAGYLLPVTMRGFFPGRDFVLEKEKGQMPGKLMLVPLVVLAALTILPGIVPGPILSAARDITEAVFGL